MKNKIIKFITVKKDGVIGDMCMAAITLICVGFLIVRLGEFDNNTLKKIKIDNITKKYILKIESEGYLSAQNENNIINELKRKGFENIRISSNKSEVQYGSDVMLDVTADVPIKTTVLDGFKFKKKIINKEIHSSISSTSKS